MDLSSVTRVETMKIELNSPALGGVTAAQPNKTEAADSNAVQQPEEDKATLSTSQASIESLTAKVLAMPEIRTDKVEALRQAISSGEYKVDPDQVAGAMIDSFSDESS
jgi:flagellar biosynthesis anti-sigma factor FlgM